MSCSLVQLPLTRGASAPHYNMYQTASKHNLYKHSSSDEPVQARVLAISGLIATSSSSTSSVSSSPPLRPSTSKHHEVEAMQMEMKQSLKGMLNSLGISEQALQCTLSYHHTSSSSSSSSSPTFTLTLTGNLSMHIASLFNIMIYNFLQAHMCIVEVQRLIKFDRVAHKCSSSTSPSPDDKSLCVDSEPILNIKCKFLARLLTCSHHVVVYAGNELATQAQHNHAEEQREERDEHNNKCSSPSAPHLSVYQQLYTWLSNHHVHYIVDESTQSPWSFIVDSIASCSTQRDKHNCDEIKLHESVLQFNGNIYSERCNSCSRVYHRDFLVASSSFSTTPSLSLDNTRKCDDCGCALKPTVSSSLTPSVNASYTQRAMSHAYRADVALILSSAMRSFMMGQLPKLTLTPQRPTPIVKIDVRACENDVAVLESGGIVIYGQVEQVLRRVEQERAKLQADMDSKRTKQQADQQKKQTDKSNINGAAATTAKSSSLTKSCQLVRSSAFKHHRVNGNITSINIGTRSSQSGFDKPCITRAQTAQLLSSACQSVAATHSITNDDVAAMAMDLTLPELPSAQHHAITTNLDDQQVLHVQDMTHDRHRSAQNNSTSSIASEHSFSAQALEPPPLLLGLGATTSTTYTNHQHSHTVAALDNSNYHTNQTF